MLTRRPLMSAGGLLSAGLAWADTDVVEIRKCSDFDGTGPLFQNRFKIYRLTRRKGYGYDIEP